MDLPIGTKIKLLRKKTKLRQFDLCNDIIDRTVLSKIENNKIAPSIKQLQHISDKLNVSLKYFFVEDGKKIDDFEHYYGNSEISDTGSTVEGMFLNGSYYKIIDLYENGKFNLTKYVNNFYYVGLSYYHCEYFTYSLKTIRRYIQSYLKQDEDFKKNIYRKLCKFTKYSM